MLTIGETVRGKDYSGTLKLCLGVVVIVVVVVGETDWSPGTTSTLNKALEEADSNKSPHVSYM